MKTIPQLLKVQEQKFKTTLEESRVKFKQRGDIGDPAEAALREFLRTYLPAAFSIGRGEVIDSFEGRSNQTDTVVLTDDHPYRGDDADLFVIDGVAAGVEVKAVLTTNELKSSLDKALKFKSLRRSADVVRNMPHQAVHKYRERAPFFIFAYESQLTLETIRKNIFEYQSGLGPGLPNLDAVFVLDRGVLIDLGNGDSLSLSDVVKDKPPFFGFVKRETGSVLLEMLAWLNAVTVRTMAVKPIMQPYLLQGMDKVESELMVVTNGELSAPGPDADVAASKG